MSAKTWREEVVVVMKGVGTKTNVMKERKVYELGKAFTNASTAQQQYQSP